ncbi:Actin-related protein 5 [Myotis davidii]|uniref:Actin-related protein 5 n=1 Tax=Myotis davidii TaxID=225400 RepID=L5LS34_MYODS|nr:Actin-related protein 5 [Myotis davidii]
MRRSRKGGSSSRSGFNARRQEEKLQLDQERLDRLQYMQELLEDGQLSWSERNTDSPEEPQSYIHKLSSVEEQAKQTTLQSEVTLKVAVVDSKPETPDLEPLDLSLENVKNIGDCEPLFFSEETPEVETPVADNLAAYHQLFVGTERIWAPEITSGEIHLAALCSK